MVIEVLLTDRKRIELYRPNDMTREKTVQHCMTMKRVDSTNSHNSNSSSSSNMNASIISHRCQGDHNSSNNNNKKKISVEEDTYWYSWFSSSCLSLLLSRLIRCFVSGRGSSLFFWLALICGISTLSNVQRSFRTTIETRVVNMNGNANIATAAQQGRFNRTNNNITVPTQTNKTRIIYSTIPTSSSDNPLNTTATTASNTENKYENEPPSSSIIIDPTSLKRGIDIFLRGNYYDTITTTDSESNNYVWDLLENYQTYHTHTRHRTSNHNSNNNLTDDDETYHYYYYEQDEISSEIICGIGPGRGMEQDAGYKLLVEKIRIVDTNDDDEHDDNASQQQQQPPPKPKILCIVYTYSPMRYLVRTQAILWGRQCDGYIAFSNETIPELGIYKLPNEYLYNYSGEVEESYDNMWQKTRRIWKYVHDHFVDEYDYFYISGDDVYLLVNNFRSYIQNELLSDSVLNDDYNTYNNNNTININNNNNNSNNGSKPRVAPVAVPRHFGSWLPSKSMIAGGPGYSLNKAALKQFFETTTTTTVDQKRSSSSSNNNNNNNTSVVWNNCLSNKHGSYEDRFMSYCMSTFLGINGNDTDTRDPVTGEQRFHDTDPATLYLFRSSNNEKGGGGSSSYFSRMASSWEDQPMPQKQQNHVKQVVVGPKHELDSAARYSISLHRIYTPTYMARIHAILYHHPTTSTSIAICPIDTPLGKGLQRHYFH
jgi:hypothetical protein